MQKVVSIALLGDFNEKKHTHLALNESIRHAAPFLAFTLQTEWISTRRLHSDFQMHPTYSGFWVTPGSPYENDEGVFNAIQWARRNNFPCLGTCGGFQYMIVEYAKNVLGFAGAGHEESDPQAGQLIISKMSCSLKGQQEEVLINDKDSWLFRILQRERFTGHFNCSYGVSPAFQKMLDHYPFVFTAFSVAGEARAVELKTHRFFKGTLFQPPLDSSAQQPNPLLMDFFRACAND